MGTDQWQTRGLIVGHVKKSMWWGNRGRTSQMAYQVVQRT
ncbi:hypothetical protein CLV78_11214 [Aliiruegeria haliotis]|uniref:Uncharacterized protein n=1 Tax=Aliiruegeria haliotis TaxID=1280846 RepID=A0A2T0RHN1_9RHOB|nr:hypothetical protein CLV78_11214 [Aliiruegeria haliotis]